jgi:hypothetical protein
MLGPINPARTNARYTAEGDGTGDTLRLANSNTNRRGPQLRTRPPQLHHRRLHCAGI